MPKPFYGYYPATVSQTEIKETVTFLKSADGTQAVNRVVVGPPKVTEPLAPRENYETQASMPMSMFGPAFIAPLGDIALARSGDKGANINIGLFVQTAQEWDWFRNFMTRDRMQDLMGEDWEDSFYIERVEMPLIFAVHFVIYGPLGRGVTSASRLDSLGKGFAEFIQAVHIPIPYAFGLPGAKL